MSSPFKGKNIPSPVEAKPVYGRFIPREELSSFAAWTPGSLDRRAANAGTSAPAEPPPPAGPTEAEVAAALRAARQSGYSDGYRDGLAALDAFKHSFATQTSARVGALIASYDAEFAQMQQQMAQALAACAAGLARNIVRSELAQRPELVAEVARQAVDALLASARQVVLRVHPDDLPLVAQGAADVLDARGARLLADASLRRGGVRVSSDIGGVDATLDERWKHCSASIGNVSPWVEEAGSAGSGSAGDAAGDRDHRGLHDAAHDEGRDPP